MLQRVNHKMSKTSHWQIHTSYVRLQPVLMGWLQKVAGGCGDLLKPVLYLVMIKKDEISRYWAVTGQ